MRGEDGAAMAERLTADLHRPFVDEITLVSPMGRPMKRVPDLIDVWFDSGAMPYAQWHFPFENKEVFARKTTPPTLSPKASTRPAAGSIPSTLSRRLIKESVQEELRKSGLGGSDLRGKVSRSGL